MAKIIGNTTATPNPRPDWAQTDETKADFIKNKPDIMSVVDLGEITTQEQLDNLFISATDGWTSFSTSYDIRLATDDDGDAVRYGFVLGNSLSGGTGTISCKILTTLHEGAYITQWLYLPHYSFYDEDQNRCDYGAAVLYRSGYRGETGSAQDKGLLFGSGRDISFFKSNPTITSKDSLSVEAPEGIELISDAGSVNMKNSSMNITSPFGINVKGEGSIFLDTDSYLDLIAGSQIRMSAEHGIQLNSNTWFSTTPKIGGAYYDDPTAEEVQTIADLGEITTQEQLDNLTSLSTGWAKFITTNQFITVDNTTQYKWLLNGDAAGAQFLLYTLKDNNGAFVQFLINSNYTYSECHWREGFNDGDTVQYGGSFKLSDLAKTFKVEIKDDVLILE